MHVLLFDNRFWVSSMHLKSLSLEKKKKKKHPSFNPAIIVNMHETEAENKIKNIEANSLPVEISGIIKS